MQESHEQQGGEAACWLDQVCEECGRVREDRSRPECEFCGHDPRGSAPSLPVAGAVRRRDRDPDGKARNARPRDGLGRPLPYGRQGVARQPEGVVRTPEATLTEAQRLLDDGMPFHAHEVLEDAWKSAPEAEAPLWKGLAQLAVGITHLARGNTKGGARLLLRGAGGIDAYRGEAPHGIDVAGLADWARSKAGSVQDAEEAEREDRPRRRKASGEAAERPAAPRLRATG
ncbi:DUF309 domain-containing protein [Streptomyces marispadix]|uniref:DUF309 domain-containing protein n=1 Tax=Streptomyces marispadix TaxID=2922868 RepID=A0ABS9SRZ0_9ACTN|nr:DUF309 domain-containing protein [Streptomyces marispadix]MCH6159046.1 DUF309 domain-containing protein [Streptomyces marispadix]